MSERSVYLRDQALKCTEHAETIGTPEIKSLLLRMAAQYAVQATNMEAEESLGGSQ